jgi:hypothetical protein
MSQLAGKAFAVKRRAYFDFSEKKRKCFKTLRTGLPWMPSASNTTLIAHRQELPRDF